MKFSDVAGKLNRLAMGEIGRAQCDSMVSTKHKFWSSRSTSKKVTEICQQILRKSTDFFLLLDFFLPISYTDLENFQHYHLSRKISRNFFHGFLRPKRSKGDFMKFSDVVGELNGLAMGEIGPARCDSMVSTKHKFKIWT